jgi:integrase
MARRERNIYKRRDGRYEARYIKGRDKNGKAKYGAVYARTYGEVKAKLEQAKMKVHESPELHNSNQLQTVAMSLEVYLNSIRNQVKVSTFGLYQRYLEKYISPHFMNIRCDQLTLEMTQDFVDRLLESGLSVVTVQSVFSFMKNGIKQMHPQNVFAVKFPKKLPNKVEVLSLDEQKRLEMAAKDSGGINNVVIIICLYTGIRIGELCICEFLQRYRNWCKGYVYPDTCKIFFNIKTVFGLYYSWRNARS